MLSSSRVLLWGVAVIVVLLAVATARPLTDLLKNGFSHPVSKAQSAQQSTPVILSTQGLKNLSRLIKQPIYWVGPQPGYAYEVTQAKNASVYIRYLPPGISPGDARPNYLSVGTYPDPSSFLTLRRVARRPGALVMRTKAGVAASNRSTPRNAYLARLGFLVELYSPSAAQTRALVNTGRVVPVT